MRKISPNFSRRHLVPQAYLITIFIVSHRCVYVVCSVSFNSEKFLISFLISNLFHFSLSRKLFCFHEFVNFLLFLLLMISSFNPWWSARIWYYFSFLGSLRLVLGPSIGSFLEKVLWGAGKKVYSLCLGEMFCKYLSGLFGL